MIRDLKKHGDFWITPNKQTIFIFIMDGPYSINIGNPKKEPLWKWDGNEEKPTLTPSLVLPEKWHGWMRAGELVLA